jgi:hypothetical protein
MIDNNKISALLEGSWLDIVQEENHGKRRQVGGSFYPPG